MLRELVREAQGVNGWSETTVIEVFVEFFENQLTQEGRRARKKICDTFRQKMREEEESGDDA